MCDERKKVKKNIKSDLATYYIGGLYLGFAVD